MRLALSVSCITLAIGCGPKERAAHAPAITPPAVRVSVVEARPRPLPMFEEVAGTIRARVRATLEAKVSGRIEELPVRLGQAVKAGQLVARLDAAEIRARLDQAQAALQQAEQDWRRQKSLYEQQAASRSEYDAAQARYAMAQGAAEEARAMGAYVEIHAPFNAVVTRKFVEVGDLAAPGKPLVEIEDADALQLDADVPEALAGQIHLDSLLTLTASGQAIEGTVSEIAPAADPASRTVRVKLDLPPKAPARSGQFARLRVPLGEREALRIPAGAVVRRGQMEIVFVARDGTAHLRLIKTGRRAGEDVEVVSGLEPGDQVVVEGVSQLIDGQPLVLK